MKVFSLAIRLTALLAIIASGAIPAGADSFRHKCSVACGGGDPSKTCKDYRVSQQQCFNKCMGYEACPGVGFPPTKKESR